MNTLVPGYKIENDGLEVEFEILSPVEITDILNPEKEEIAIRLQEIDAQISACEEKIHKLEPEIERLTNHADGLDYTVAVVSGIISGLIDSFYVGEWNFKNAKDITNNKVNNKVIEFAKKDPRYIPWCKNTASGRKERDPNRLKSAIEFLEEKYPLPGDNAWNTKKELVNLAKSKGFSGKGYDEALKFMNENFPKVGGWSVLDTKITASTHRLDDFCHHPTLIGMLCSIIVQFTGETMYNHNSGNTINIPIVVNEYGKFVGNNPLTKVMSGVINWFITCAQTIANQKGHLMSDIATPSGIPGPVMSFLKELSALPCFKNKNFSESLRKAFQNGIGNGKKQLDLGAFNQLFEGASSKFDIRTEKAVAHEFKRQSIPVIVNEALVRGFYFIRRFIEQMKLKKSIFELDWKSILPVYNRTIVRMMTIATGTFTAVDVADAAIRSRGFNAACLLRVNFVGVGRFAIAIVTDTSMGVKRGHLVNERMAIMSKELTLLNAKVSYKNALAYLAQAEAFEKEEEMWIAAENAEEALNETYKIAEASAIFIKQSFDEISDSFEKISQYRESIERYNPGFTEEMINTLLYGRDDNEQ